MPTRLYLPSTGAAAVSPAYDSGWAVTSGATRRAMVVDKIASAMTTASVSYGSQSGGDFGLVRQYVGPPMAAQTISGTIKAQMRTSETDTANNVYDRMGLRVVSNDGTVVRGTLKSVATYGPTTEFATSLTNRIYADGDTVSSVVCEDGDRLVVEFGGGRTLSWTGDFAISFGDNSGTDLPEDDTTTAANNPWLEFSMTIAWQDISGSVSVSDLSYLQDSSVVMRNVTREVADQSSIYDAIQIALWPIRAWVVEQIGAEDAAALFAEFFREVGDPGETYYGEAEFGGAEFGGEQWLDSLSDGASITIHRESLEWEQLPDIPDTVEQFLRAFRQVADRVGAVSDGADVTIPSILFVPNKTRGHYRPRWLLSGTISGQVKRYSSQDLETP